MYMYMTCSLVVVYSRGDLKRTLEAVARTADSLCDGDVVERVIRRSQGWSLLPVQVGGASDHVIILCQSVFSLHDSCIVLEY